MNATTLRALTDRISLQRCRQLIPGLYEAFRLAELNTVKRRAMFFAQVLEESVGLSATTEFASGDEYEWRQDLGNTRAGDGRRFKGRGFIQLTGRTNYGHFSQWCHQRRVVPSDHHFLDHPEQVADDVFAWLSAAWYWAHPHPHDGLMTLNQAADAGNLVTATHMVNGGENGLDTRRYYYTKALNLGQNLMTPVGPNDPNWSDVMNQEELGKFVDARLAAAVFGTTDAGLHRARPGLYPGPNEGLGDRIHAQSIHQAAQAARLDAQASRLGVLEQHTGIANANTPEATS